jgi:hypothetical protein
MKVNTHKLIGAVLPKLRSEAKVRSIELGRVIRREQLDHWEHSLSEHAWHLADGFEVVLFAFNDRRVLSLQSHFAAHSKVIDGK